MEVNNDTFDFIILMKKKPINMYSFVPQHTWAFIYIYWTFINVLCFCDINVKEINMSKFQVDNCMIYKFLRNAIFVLIMAYNAIYTIYIVTIRYL